MFKSSVIHSLFKIIACRERRSPDYLLTSDFGIKEEIGVNENCWDAVLSSNFGKFAERMGRCFSGYYSANCCSFTSSQKVKHILVSHQWKFSDAVESLVPNVRIVTCSGLTGGIFSTAAESHTPERQQYLSKEKNRVGVSQDITQQIVVHSQAVRRLSIFWFLISGNFQMMLLHQCISHRWRRLALPRNPVLDSEKRPR